MIVTITADVVKLCPYVDEVDKGTVAIELDIAPGAQAPELHALRADLDAFWDVRISHEDFTRHLTETLDHVRSVRTQWTTAGMSVQVEHRPVA